MACVGSYRLNMVKVTPLPNSKLITLTRVLHWTCRETSFEDLNRMLQNSWQSVVREAIIRENRYAWCQEPDILKTQSLECQEKPERKATLPVIVTAFQTDMVKHKYKPHVSKTSKRCNVQTMQKQESIPPTWRCWQPRPFDLWYPQVTWKPNLRVNPMRQSAAVS